MSEAGIALQKQRGAELAAQVQSGAKKPTQQEVAWATEKLAGKHGGVGIGYREYYNAVVATAEETKKK